MKTKIFFILMYLLCIEAKILAQSTIEVNVEKIGVGICKGPEAIAIDNEGFIYSGMEDGQIIRFSPDGLIHEVIARTGGRPVGLKFDSEGNLLVCDAYKGLLSLGMNGNISVLTTEHDGKPYKLTDDLDFSINGIVYFSDASYKYSLDNYWPNDYPHPNGRLLAYDPLTKATSLILDSLYFANGVVISPDQSFVLINETWKNRVCRFWLSGPQQGQSDFFINNLPGEPDNITFNGKEIFWLAIYNSSILGLDLLGNIKYILEYPVNSYPNLTSVIQHNNKLYLGSLTGNAIGCIQLPDSVTNINYFYQNNPIDFSLMQNYPNPFNPTTIISYQLPQQSHVELTIYNMTGQKITTVVSERQSAGSYQYEWDAEHVTSGVYLYRIAAGKFVETKKLVLLK